MGKADTVSAQLAAIQTAETQALTDGLGVCYDQGGIDQKASDGTLTQADLDAAVAAATGPLNAQITQLNAQVVTDASNLSAAQAQAAQQLASVQSQLDAMTAQDQVDKGLVLNFQNSISALQTALDALKAAIPVPPTPVPVPVPAP